MEKTKLTLRIEKPIIESAKAYAERHNTTLSRLVAEFLRSLGVAEDMPSTPILTELTGILPANVSSLEYTAYLEKNMTAKLPPDVSLASCPGESNPACR